MQALNDERHIRAIEAKVDRLEEKIDKGFAEMRADSAEVRAQIVSTERALHTEIVMVRGDGRSDFRTLIAVVFAMWTATVLGVIGVLLNHL
jgi:hypothetical protein